MERRYYPALRGIFGDWVYYSCLMSMQDVAERLSYAADIHKSKKLSELIQRKLKEGRSKEIAKYLLVEKQRFFNSLVVAIYGGDPAWHGFSNFKPQAHDIDLADVPDEVEDSVGFLSFSGGEEIFALDGQHRLAGMKAALRLNAKLGNDQVSLVLVAHQKTSEGQERTRRLFTTLNKRAVAVGKGEIIALDENDVMAIVTRHLVENVDHFAESRIRFSQGESLPQDAKELTTIGNLYDVLKILFSKLGYAPKATELRFIRPTDAELKKYIRLATEFFDGLVSRFQALADYFAATPEAAPATVQQHRRRNGGHVLFRPVGLRLFAEVAVDLASKNGGKLKKAFASMEKLPVELSQIPYKNVIWLQNGNLNPKERPLCRRLLLHMLGHEKNPTDLQKRYANLLGNPNVKLPPLLR